MAVVGLLAVLAAGCGSDGGAADRGDASPTSPAGTPTPAESSSPGTSAPAESSAPADDWVQIAVLDVPQIGQATDPSPAVLDSRAAVDAYASGLGRSADRMSRQLRRAIRGADLPDGWVPVAAVVHVGCEGPESVAVDTSDGLAVTAVGLPKNTVQCFVAHTYVGVVGVAPEVVG